MVGQPPWVPLRGDPRLLTFAALRRSQTNSRLVFVVLGCPAMHIARQQSHMTLRTCFAIVLSTAAAAVAEPPAAQTSPAPPWRELEAPLLANHVQLTFRDKFVK